MEIVCETARLPDLAPSALFCELKPHLIISLRAAGDRGPSGSLGHERHGDLARLAGWGELPVFSLKQTHSLRIVILKAGAPARLVQGSWAQGVLELHATDIPDFVVPEVLDPAGHTARDLARRIGMIEGDGIITDLPILLGVTVADCLPIAITLGPWRGLLHSGWQGTGILDLALNALHELGAVQGNTQELSLVFGPSVAPEDYPVDFERARLFAARFGAARVIAHGSGQPALDIPGANRHILDAFLAKQRASFSLGLVSLTCFIDSTVSHGALHSYRRDGKDFGRMLVLYGTGK